MPVRLRDSQAPLKSLRRTSGDGYLIADSFVARTGIQVYRGREVDPENEVGLRDREEVRVYRPEAEVRRPESMASFSHAPVTMGHPKEDVNSTNWKDLAIGEASTEAVWEGNKIRIPLIIKDQAAVDRINAGTSELSPGYTSTIEVFPGQTPEGEPFDAVQRNIRINHIAVVDRGRSGKEVRIADDAEEWGAAPINKAEKFKEKPMNLQTLLVDGLSVETTETGAQAIKKLQSALADAEARLDTADREVASLQGKLEAAEAKIPTPEQFDAQVRDRAALLSKARQLADTDYTGLSTEEVRRKAVRAKLGDAAVEGRSDAYVEVRFDDALAGIEQKPDGVHSALSKTARVADTAGGPTWDDIHKQAGYSQ